MFTSSHFGLRVRNLTSAKKFYVEQLELPLLQDMPSMAMFAVRAGNIRLSIFEGRDDAGESTSQIILATENLAATLTRLATRGVVAQSAPTEAPGFMRSVYVLDPDGNRIGIAQYLRDPLIPI